MRIPLTINHQQTGFTLLEVMVALLIFSVGLLGLAGMQMSGMQNNHDAMLRTIATQRSYDMAERIRASGSGYIVADDQNVQSCSSAACTQINYDDYAAWLKTIADNLPGGSGQVSDLGGGVVRITVRWDEDSSGATGTGCDPANPSDLKCIQLTIIP